MESTPVHLQATGSTLDRSKTAEHRNINSGTMDTSVYVPDLMDSVRNGRIYVESGRVRVVKKGPMLQYV